MSEETPDEKVVSLKTRKAWKGPKPKPSASPIEVPAPDEGSIKAAEMVLEALKKSEAAGLIALTWNPVQRKFDMWINLPIEDGFHEVVLRSLGAIELLKDIMMQIAVSTDLDGEEDDE